MNAHAWMRREAVWNGAKCHGWNVGLHALSFDAGNLRISISVVACVRVTNDDEVITHSRTHHPGSHSSSI